MKTTLKMEKPGGHPLSGNQHGVIVRYKCMANQTSTVSVELCISTHVKAA